MRVLVTGGCGFIGSHLCRLLLKEHSVDVINVDVLTYAGFKRNVADLDGQPGYSFHQADITDRARMIEIFKATAPEAVINCAAESHVDRSISDPTVFVRTNVIGVSTLLDVAMATDCGRFLQVSTDECFGSLVDSEDPFTEDTPLRPSTPYSVSKASGDLLAQSYHQMYAADVVITRCSNNYGSHQHPEKFIPKAILRLLRGEAVQLHGRGQHVRDWINVQDHCRGIVAALQRGRSGHIYNLGGDCERRTLQIAHVLCDITNNARTKVEFVPDRPGNDHRYAMDFRKARHELGWFPTGSLRAGLEQTVAWYKEHADWWTP
jgi:dTDP-glucose 4,6-dehydratase